MNFAAVAAEIAALRAEEAAQENTLIKRVNADVDAAFALADESAGFQSEAAARIINGITGPMLDADAVIVLAAVFRSLSKRAIFSVDQIMVIVALSDVIAELQPAGEDE